MTTLYYESELYHHGVKGQKWGRRRWQNPDGTLTPAGRARMEAQTRAVERSEDEAQRSSLTRHAAASARNLRMRSRMHDASEEVYNTARDAYNKELRRPSLFMRKKQERVKAASDVLRDAGERATETMGERNRAERIYDADVKALKDHVDGMIKKYGSDSVAEVRTRTRELGENYTKEMVRTGVTLANLPIIGQMYTGRYVAPLEEADRRKKIKEHSEKRFY